VVEGWAQGAVRGLAREPVREPGLARGQEPVQELARGLGQVLAPQAKAPSTRPGVLLQGLSMKALPQTDSAGHRTIRRSLPTSVLCPYRESESTHRQAVGRIQPSCYEP
jgi:hypothetical protein